MAFRIPDDSNLFHYANNTLQELLQNLSNLQVYIDDWSVLPRDVQTIVKDRLAAILISQQQFLADLKEYISNL